MSISILALDTATEACSVALWYKGEIYRRYRVSDRDHTQHILPMVDQVLVDAGIGMKQLDALAFGCGPGSFTGIRIGVGITQGLALGADLPVIPVSTLKTLAQGAWREAAQSNVLTAIDARMSELYWGIFQRDSEGRWDVLEAEALLSPQDVADKLASLIGTWATAGTGWPAYPQLAEKYAVDLPTDTNKLIKLINDTILLPDAQDILPLALADWEQGRAIAVGQATPVYLRNQVAWKKTTSN